jgi:hypothetical protein
MSLPGMQARGFTIRCGHQLDTIERSRVVVEQLTDRVWKYVSLGPDEYHVYPEPPPPPSQPPTMSDVIVFPQCTTIVVAYIVFDDSKIKSVYAEVLDSNTYERIELNNADDVPDNAVSYSAIFNFMNLAPGNSYIVKICTQSTPTTISQPGKNTLKSLM